MTSLKPESLSVLSNMSSLHFHKVLIVDDFQSMRKIIAEAIQDLGITEVVQANDGHEALEKVRQCIDKKQLFDLILCDQNMPKVSGLDFLKALRATPETSKIPFIMITAESDREDVIEALAAGANDYIVKPLSPDTIRRKIINLKKL